MCSNVSCLLECIPCCQQTQQCIGLVAREFCFAAGFAADTAGTALPAGTEAVAARVAAARAVVAAVESAAGTRAG